MQSHLMQNIATHQPVSPLHLFSIYEMLLYKAPHCTSSNNWLRNFFGCYCSSQSNLAFLQAERNYTSSSKDQKSGVVSNSALQELKMFPGRTDLSFLPWVGRLRNGGAYTVIGRTHSPFSLFSTRSGCSYLEKREARITHSVSCRRLGRYSHFRATDDTLNKVKLVK